MLVVAAPGADAACARGKDCPRTSYSVFATAPDVNHVYAALDVDQAGNVCTVVGGQSDWEVQIFDRTGNTKARWPCSGFHFRFARGAPLSIAVRSDAASSS
jgi:hypothetical protein